MKTPHIDRDKLRVFVRQLDEGALLMLLDHAIDLLPKTRLPKLIEGHAPPEKFRPDSTSAKGLLSSVRRFHAASLAGEYYEDFRVNSQNFMDSSRGTQSFTAEYHRLLDRCQAAVAKGQRAEPREALELLFDLLRQIDQCRDDIVFFADEGGSWQIGVDYRTVLPVWFQCVAATSPADEYVSAVRGAIEEFASHDADTLIKAARRVASKQQRAALRR